MQYVSRNRPGEIKVKLIDLGKTELEALIDEWIIGFDSANRRAMLKSRLIDGLTFEKLAEVHNKSPRQARKIIHACEEILFKHIPG